MSTPSATHGLRCPDCGAPLSSSIDGLCAACLLRLATADPTEPSEAREEDPSRFADWLKVKGQRVGNYELLEEIARGGMGIVYRARQVNAGRIVALKIMLPHLLPLPGMRERFRREVEAVARLDHPGILPIYEVGEHAGLPLFSMKLAEGGSLDRRIRELDGKWQEIASLVAMIAHAVEHAHERGILHRDLKPANILFDAAGRPMVADFGLAKFRIAQDGLTVPASALGSPSYMAPEQLNAELGELGPATDVYGLGAVLYELLTGKPPIGGEDALDTLRKVATQVPAAGRDIRHDLPADLDTIALKCLEKRPAARYTSAAGLAQDLEEWIAGGKALAARQRRAIERKRWGIRLAACLIAVVTGVGTWVFVRPLGASLSGGPVVGQAAPAAPRSIGVLPFRNLSSAQANAELTAIVADDILRELRQVETLSVVPFRVAPGPEGRFDPTQLAHQLGVDMLLDGAIERRQDGESLGVRVRLWDARMGRAVWEHAFDASARDVRDLRASIAAALVTALQIEVGADVRAQLSRDAPTADAEAYRKYLRARYLLRWRRPEILVEAARELRGAIARDPTFARAHSALAYVYALWVPPQPAEGDHWELAEQFARSALDLDPTLAEPHAVLGNRAAERGRYVDAELAFRRAMELDSRDPATLHFYAIHLYSVGRLREALAMEQRSVALDSRSPQPMMWLAMLTTLAGDREQALQLWQRTDELGAARPLAAAVVRLEVGQSEPLAEWYRANFERTGVPESMRDERALLAGVLDPSQRDAALEWLRRVEHAVDPAFAITHYAILGDADSAMRIASSYDLVDDFWYLYQLTNIWAPRTSPLRRDPRFGALLERWGFVDYWRRFGPPDLCILEPSRVACR